MSNALALFDWRPVSYPGGLLPVLVPPPPPVEPGTSDEVRRVREGLERRIAAQISSGAELIEALATKRRTELLASSLEPLDELLGGGLARGKITEVAGRRGMRYSIAVATLAATTAAGEAAAFIDLGDHFDPQLAERAGADLRRLLWIRPHTLKQAVTAAEMVGATGFQLVALDAGRRIRSRRVPDAAWVRLARMAESYGTALLVTAPYPLAGTAAEAVVSAFGSRARWLGGNGSPRILAGIETRIRLEKHRKARTGRSASIFFKTEEAV